MMRQRLLRKSYLFQNIHQLDYLNLIGRGKASIIGYLLNGQDINLKNLLAHKEMID